MDLMESLRILRARWILTSALLLLTLAATVGAFVMLPWAYQSQATTVLLPSEDFAKSAGGNPYLAFTGSLTLTADVLRRELTDPRTGLALAARGYSSPYLVAAATDTTGPVLLITVTGPKRAAVQHTLQGVTAEVSAKLVALQSGISTPNQIRSLVISATPQATASVSKKAKPLVVVLAFGLLLTFAIPQIVNARSSRKRKRHGRTARVNGSDSGGNRDHGDDDMDGSREITHTSEPAAARPDGHGRAQHPADAAQARSDDRISETRGRAR